MLIPIIYYFRTKCKTEGKIIWLNKISFLIIFCFEKTVLFYSYAHLTTWIYGGVPSYEKVNTKNGVEEETYISGFTNNSLYLRVIFLVITVIECIITIIIVPLLKLFEHSLKPAHNTNQSHEKPIIGLVRFFVKTGITFLWAIDPYYVK